MMMNARVLTRRMLRHATMTISTSVNGGARRRGTQGGSSLLLATTSPFMVAMVAYALTKEDEMNQIVALEKQQEDHRPDRIRNDHPPGDCLEKDEKQQCSNDSNKKKRTTCCSGKKINKTSMAIQQQTNLHPIQIQGHQALLQEHMRDVLHDEHTRNETARTYPPTVVLTTSSRKDAEIKRRESGRKQKEAKDQVSAIQRMTSIMQYQTHEDDQELITINGKQHQQVKMESVYDENEDAGDDDNGAVPSYIPASKKDELGGSLSHHITHKTHPEAQHLQRNESQYPIEKAELAVPPFVPPPITRQHPARVIVDLYTTNKRMKISGNKKFEYWPYGFYDLYERRFRYSVPGPFIRARVGDVLQINFTNVDESGMAHSVDFHAVIGPGGGAPTTFAEQDETKVGAFLLQKPGLYVYHCAAAPIPVHIHNGMFGLILVEPAEGMRKVDKEFYIMQSELYLQANDDDENEYENDYTSAEKEIPSHVVFNGREGALVDKPIMVKQDETVRLFVGNAGPNLVSSFHVIGGVFDRCYRDGDLISPPARYVQTTLVPAGGATAVEMEMQVPGTYAIVDHSINRIDKGAVGMIKVKGKPRPDIYDSLEPPAYCAGCKVHQ